jgi:hypothetical protein
MNLDSKFVQKTMQSLLTDVAPKVLTTPDISNVASIVGDSNGDGDRIHSTSRHQRKPHHQRKHRSSHFYKTFKKNNKPKNVNTTSSQLSVSDHRDPVIALYEKMNAANVEVNHQNNAGCFKFQESAIDIQSQVPGLETLSDKFLSREMREYIQNDAKKTLTFECKINQRDIRIFFVLFRNHTRCKEVASYYKSYARRVFMWLHMISLKSSCVESLDIYIYLTPFKKRLPENKSEVIGPVNANTGYTYRCEKKNEIVIYRQEEWFKVFLHETMHSFGNDFHEEEDGYNSTMDLRKIFSLPQEISIRMSETYSEIWARIMNVAFQTYFKNPPSLESQTANQFKKNFEFYLNVESVFSLYQCIKILDFMGVNYQVLIDESEHSKKMMRSFYRENTHVFAYYVLTSILLHNCGDFLRWCVKKNGHGLDMFKVKATQRDFVELIASCYKKNDLLQKIVKTEMKVARDYQKAISAPSQDDNKEDGDGQLVTTLRMTIVGFD